MTNARMRHQGDTHTTPLKQRTLRVLASACVLGLLAMSDTSFATSFDAHRGCRDLCSEEFWAKAHANDVDAAFAREPEAVSYLHHILRLAIASGVGADGVAALLRAGAPPNTRYEGGYNRYVLHEAVRHGEEIVSALLKGGALPGLADNNGGTPLHEAVQSNRAGAAVRLIEAGADPATPDASGTTPIDIARDAGNDDILALLMAPRAPRPSCWVLCTTEFWKASTVRTLLEAEELLQESADDPNGRTPEGDSPLHVAMAMGAGLKSVELLLRYGADPNVRNALDNTPLHVAAGNAGDAAAVELLLARGALRDAANADGWTPLHIASESAATIGTMRALLEAGANPDIRAGHLFGVSPRELAAQQPEGLAATKLLLEFGDGPPDAGETARAPLLHHAARAGHPATVEMLLDRGALPGEVDAFGNTAIHEAAGAGNIEAMRVLLAQGADGDPPKHDGTAVVREHGRTLLRIAAPFPKVVALLLAHGARLNGDPDAAEETPLHAASRICQASSLTLLLARGANPNARNEFGDTPLTHAILRVAASGRVSREEMSKSCSAYLYPRARERCRAEANEEFDRRFAPRKECEKNISLLIEHGADSLIPGDGGLTPLAVARRENLDDGLIRLMERSNEREQEPDPSSQAGKEVAYPTSNGQSDSTDPSE